MPHAHSLIGKNSNDGVVTVQIGPEHGMTARYCNLDIVIKVKSYLPEICLLERVFCSVPHRNSCFFLWEVRVLIYVQFYRSFLIDSPFWKCLHIAIQLRPVARIFYQEVWSIAEMDQTMTEVLVSGLGGITLLETAFWAFWITLLFSNFLSSKVTFF